MHTCSHAVVGCMDFRIQKTVDNLLEHLNIHQGSFDRVTCAGGAANTDQLKTHLGLSKKLHDSSTAVLSVHEDCGAGAKKEELLKAAETARSLGFDPKLFYIKLDGTWEEVKAD
jgi:hypothetical protein